jgi:predicted N-acetyltransferase YhbS
LRSSFGTEFGGRSYFMQRHHVRLVALDPEICGHIGLIYRSVRQGDRLIPILGLADVATDPGRRGQGIASTLLKAAIAEGHASPAAFIALFGDAGLYAGHGFMPAMNRLRYVDLDGARTGEAMDGGADGLMILPLGGAVWDEVTPLDLLGHKF